MDSLEVVFLLASAFGLLVAVAIFMLNPGRMINLGGTIVLGVFSLWSFSIFMAIHVGNQPHIYPRSLLLFWVRMASAVAAFLPWGLYLIKESILFADSPTAIIRRSAPWALASLALAFLAFSESFLPSENLNALQARGAAYMGYLVSMAALCTTVLYGSISGLRRSTGIARIELKLFAINFSLTTLVVLGMFILNSFLKIYYLRYVGSAISLTSIILVLWILCSHKVFDARQVMRTLTRRVLGLLLVTALAAAILMLAKPLMAPSYAIFLTIITVGLVAVELDRATSKWINRNAAQQTNRTRQQIIDLAKTEPDETRLIQRFEQLLCEWNQTSQAIILINRGASFVGKGVNLDITWSGALLLTEEGWITPESIRRRRRRLGSEAGIEFMTAHDLGALIAVPQGSPTPSLLVGLGRKPSLRPYTYPNILLVLELAELIDNVLMHARIAARTAQIEKMEAAAMMSRSLAHDLNNLATPVSAFLMHMESRVQQDSTEAEVLADAKHSLRVMQEYIRESLFFARRLVPDFRSTSARALADSTLRVTQERAAARGVDVRINEAPEITFVADAVLVQRLLQNLVLNGIDATPRGGQVTVAAARADPGRIRFAVADEGPGIPAEIIDKIFEPYFTTKDTGDKIRGLGLGLAVSKKIADLHGGSIQVARTARGGALFTVTLPLKPASVI